MTPLLFSGVCSLLSSMPGIFMLMFGRASDFHWGGGGGGTDRHVGISLGV